MYHIIIPILFGLVPLYSSEPIAVDLQEEIVFADDLSHCFEQIHGSTLDLSGAISLLTVSLDRARWAQTGARPSNYRPTRYDETADGLLNMITAGEYGRHAVVMGDSVEEDEARERPAKRKKTNDEDDDDYVLVGEGKRRRKVSRNTMEIIVRMKLENKSDATIRAKYPWYQYRDFLNFKEQLNGSRITDKRKALNAKVLERLKDSRERGIIVRGDMIQEWGREFRSECHYDDFKASSSWLYQFLRNNGLVSRRVTERVTQAQIRKLGQRSREREEFTRRFLRGERPFETWVYGTSINQASRMSLPAIEQYHFKARGIQSHR